MPIPNDASSESSRRNVSNDGLFWHRPYSNCCRDIEKSAQGGVIYTVSIRAVRNPFCYMRQEGKSADFFSRVMYSIGDTKGEAARAIEPGLLRP